MTIENVILFHYYYYLYYYPFHLTDKEANILKG